MPKATSGVQSLVVVNAVSHLALEVSDLARSISFYESVLGLDIFQDNRDDRHQPNVKGLIGGFAIELAQTAFIPHHRVRRIKTDKPAGHPCLSFSIPDARSTLQRLKVAGHISTESITVFQGAQFFFITDPDGNVFELIEFPGSFKTLGDLAPLLRNRADKTTKSSGSCSTPESS
jgi:glyoxylase I family protein